MMSYPRGLEFSNIKRSFSDQATAASIHIVSNSTFINHPTIWRQMFRLQTASLNIHKNIGRRIVQRTTEILNNHTCIPLKCKTNQNIFTKGGGRGESSGRRSEWGMWFSDRQYIYYYGETENLLLWWFPECVRSSFWWRWAGGKVKRRGDDCKVMGSSKGNKLSIWAVFCIWTAAFPHE